MSSLNLGFPVRTTRGLSGFAAYFFTLLLSFFITFFFIALMPFIGVWRFLALSFIFFIIGFIGPGLGAAAIIGGGGGADPVANAICIGGAAIGFAIIAILGLIIRLIGMALLFIIIGGGADIDIIAIGAISG